MNAAVRHHPGTTKDEGIALVVAIALIALVGVVIATLVAVAMYESRASGRDRQRSQAVMAAEQQVDTLLSLIQVGGVGTVPCGSLPVVPVSVVSDRLDVQSSVTYYDNSQPEPQVIDCASVQAGTVRAYQALVSAKAVSEPIADQAPATRTVEMMLQLEPNYGNDLTKAIFGDAGIALSNHADIYGEDGQPNADVYTNGNVVCNNNQHYYGSIYAQGSVSMANTCVVEVDVHAGTGFVGSNPGVAVNGRIMVAGGDATLDKNMQVGKQVLTSGTINDGGGVCSEPNKCFPNTAVPPVPYQAFPIMNADSGSIAEWQAAGYTDVVRIGPGGNAPAPFDQCGWYNGPKLVGADGKQTDLNGKADVAAAWIFANAYKLTAPTILISTCSQGVSMQGIDIELNNNLVVFSDAGFTFSNKTIITSTNGDQRSLYLIQPYDAVGTHPCTSQGISLDNQVDVKPTVDMLLYSPCNVRKANNTTHYGQIYAGGTAQIDNKLTMYYQPLPVFGVQASSAIESYNTEIQFKRENH